MAAINHVLNTTDTYSLKSFFWPVTEAIIIHERCLRDGAAVNTATKRAKVLIILIPGRGAKVPVTIAAVTVKRLKMSTVNKFIAIGGHVRVTDVRRAGGLYWRLKLSDLRLSARFFLAKADNKAKSIKEKASTAKLKSEFRLLPGTFSPADRRSYR